MVKIEVDDKTANIYSVTNTRGTRWVVWAKRSYSVPVIMETSSRPNNISNMAAGLNSIGARCAYDELDVPDRDLILRYFMAINILGPNAAKNWLDCGAALFN